LQWQAAVAGSSRRRAPLAVCRLPLAVVLSTNNAIPFIIFITMPIIANHKSGSKNY
jgi:hypothetical protein